MRMMYMLREKVKMESALHSIYRSLKTLSLMIQLLLIYFFNVYKKKRI